LRRAGRGAETGAAGGVRLGKNRDNYKNKNNGKNNSNCKNNGNSKNKNNSKNNSKYKSNRRSFDCVCRKERGKLRSG
jgi:hypothetical protein